MLSDDSTSDSDSGIRFKTDSTRREKEKNADLALLASERGKGRGKDNWRSRGGFSGNRDRDRQGRRSPPRARARSPQRSRGRIDTDRFERSERPRGDQSRQRDRSRENHSRDERHERNGAKKESQGRKEGERRKEDQRRPHSRENSEETIKRDKHRDKISFSDKHTSKDTDHKRDESKKTHESRDSKSKDVKERLKPEGYSSERLSRKSPPHNRTITRDAIQSIQKIIKDDSQTRDRDSISANRARAISPIRFGRSPADSRKLSPASKEKDKKRKADRSPVLSKRPQNHKNVRLSESPLPAHDLSDSEPKPVSYYNMTSNIPHIPEASSDKPVIEETIAVSDSSEDEVELRKKLLLLEDELKKTKKKTKHKEKKAKKHRKKTKANKSSSEPMSNSEKSDQAEVSLDDTRNMKVTITSAKTVIDRRIVTNKETGLNKTPPLAKKCEESNEEGEIVSDSDDQKNAIDSSDLRHKLGRQIGPMLPSIAQNKPKIPDLRERLALRDDREVSTPSPALPTHVRKKEEFDDGNSPVVEGPALPPHLKKSYTEKTTKHLGPSLSAEMRESLAHRADHSESDEDVVGPLPEGSGLSSEARVQLEERALALRLGALEPAPSKAEAREEWMLELPDAKAKILGLGPRQFRAKEGPDMSDRSMWTDTPQEKAQKAAGLDVPDEDKVKEDLQREAELHFIAQRDKEQEEAARKHKKKHKRDKSLLELHEKKLEKKKKKDKESGESTRRPFDRDIDLKANRFDEAQKKSIMKKAQLLDTRFSTGENKFL